MPVNETDRLAALRGLRILDTPPEERFDRVVRLAALLFDVPIAYISFVDHDRQWLKSRIGMPVSQTPRQVSFCGHAVLQEEALIVPNALEDPRFAGNPLVTSDPHVRFYAGHPVKTFDGFKIGTLCLMDKRPRNLDRRERQMLGQLATLVEHELQLVDTIAVQNELLRVKERLLDSQRHLTHLYDELKIAKAKSDELLLNILPAKVADELKEHGRVAAELCDDVCVMFTDFTEFTALSRQLSPGELVEELNVCFSRFDEITARHGVERLKTIGDGYLCVAGLLSDDKNTPLAILRTALEIRDYIATRRCRAAEQQRPYWNVRLGLHIGPLVAGVVGVRKFAFDVWGDTVNVAKRIESAGEPGRINVTRDFLDRVQGSVLSEARGLIPVKGKGEMEMFFINGLDVD